METFEKVNKLYDDMKKTMMMLYARWLDERKYEDFQDYVNHMKKVFEQMKILNHFKADFIEARKKPFGFAFKIDNVIVVFTINSREYKWKAKKFLKNI